MGKKSSSSSNTAAATAAAQATADANARAAEQTTAANRVNQYNPYGSLTYSKNADGTWNQYETYTPEAKAAIDSELRVKQGLSSTAEGMIGRVQDAYSKEFDAPKWDTYRSGVGAVDRTKQTPMGDFSSDATVDQSVIDPSGVNVNAPQFSKDRQDQYTKAAYDAEYGLRKGDMEAEETRLRNQLALQGLAPTTEASSGAMGSYYDGRSRELGAMADRAVLTGNTMSNNDYSSELAGFKAGNDALGQQFSQYLQSQQAKNAAAGQKYTQDQGTYSTNLQGKTINEALRSGYNASQAQEYDQAQKDYGTTWQEEQTLRNMPQNELLALLSAGQVQNPSYDNYALQGNPGGADYLGAYTAANQASSGSSNTAAWGNLLGGVFGAAGQAGGFGNLFGFSDERLKENVHKIAETPDGTNVYTWQWKPEAREIGADKQPNIGVIAQEHPKDTVKGKRGYLMYDYSKFH